MAVASGAYDIVLTGGTNVNASSFDLSQPPHLRRPDPAVPQAINQLASDQAYFYPCAVVFPNVRCSDRQLWAQVWGFAR